MELWLRYRIAEHLHWDRRVSVSSEPEWRDSITHPDVISSVQWPIAPLFPINYLHAKRRHRHEIGYTNKTDRNLAFREACQRLAGSIDRDLAGARCLVYAPLRGALPIWRGIAQFLQHVTWEVYHPVTSSFISYPAGFRVPGRKQQPISGRYANVLELERLRPLLGNYDVLLYVDEIVSGAMMQGHLKEMFALGIQKLIPIVAAGIADRDGRKSELRRAQLTDQVKSGLLRAFLWEGCPSLITEDQKFLLGIHYVDYTSGPNIVPFLGPDLHPYPEKMDFDRDVFRSPPQLEYTAPSPSV